MDPTPHHEELEDREYWVTPLKTPHEQSLENVKKILEEMRDDLDHTPKVIPSIVSHNPLPTCLREGKMGPPPKPKRGKRGTGGSAQRKKANLERKQMIAKERGAWIPRGEYQRKLEERRREAKRRAEEEEYLRRTIFHRTEECPFHQHHIK